MSPRFTTWFAGLLLAALPIAGPAVERASAAGSLTSDAALRSTVEDQGRAFIEAVESEDGTVRSGIARRILSSRALAADGEAKFLRLFARLHESMGPLTFHHAEAVASQSGEGTRVSLHVYARAAADSLWRDFQFQLEPVAPHRIETLFFIANVTEPVYLPNGDITSANTLEWLNGYIDKLAGGDDLAGGLLIASGENVILERTFGFADEQKRWPIGPDTRFNMASGGKMFTALAIAQLVGAGKLAMNDPVVRHVPELGAAGLGSGVTLEQLLTHTSGLGEFWDEVYERDWHAIRTLRDFLPHVLRVGTDFAPGERFEYSNTNYILAGLVLESVTGRSYDQVLRERIFEPTGMRHTGLDPFDSSDSLQAVPLAGRARSWHPAEHGYRGSSAGGALTTMGDMLRFGRALAGGRVVSDSMLAAMVQSRTEGLPGRMSVPYGFGFEPQVSADGVRSFGHGGIATGVNFEFRYFPDSDITLIAFSNQDNGAYDDLRRNTTRLITGER